MLIDAPLEIDSTSPNSNAQILSAYHGLDQLPEIANFICDTPVEGEDGMPVTFSVQLSSESVSPMHFAVETHSGEIVTPLCATLRPAIEPQELRTVLLAGSFGSPEEQPRSVEIVGTLEDLEGNSLSGLRTDEVTPLESGPRVILAERFLPTAPGLENECPPETAQILQLVWEGGVHAAEHAPLGEAQRLGISFLLENGQTVIPTRLGDDDPDNFVIACINQDSPATSVTVEANLFYDPGEDPNPQTSAEVVNRVP